MSSLPGEPEVPKQRRYDSEIRAVSNELCGLAIPWYCCGCLVLVVSKLSQLLVSPSVRLIVVGQRSSGLDIGLVCRLKTASHSRVIAGCLRIRTAHIAGDKQMCTCPNTQRKTKILGTTGNSAVVVSVIKPSHQDRTACCGRTVLGRLCHRQHAGAESIHVSDLSTRHEMWSIYAAVGAREFPWP